MGKAKHTPGPWWYVTGGGNYFPHVVVGGSDPKAKDYIVINSVAGENGGEMDECEANARLIAKAPELLHMVKQLMHWVPEPVLSQADYESPPEPATKEDWQRGMDLYEAQKLIDEIEPASPTP